MEKKICEICAKEFESEDLEETLCPECKNEVVKDVAEENDVLDTEEIEAEADEISSDEEVYQDGEEISEEEEVVEEELSEEERLALEQERLEKELKKKKKIKIVSITAGVIALIAVVLFVPFKKDNVADKRVNLFTSIQSVIEFSNDNETAMIIGDEEIDKGLFNYFFERAQYNLMAENLKSDATEEDVKNFWSKQIDGKNAIDVARENAKKDVIQFVVGKQAAEKNNISMSDEEEENLEQYMEDYITEDFLAQMKLTKEQVKYILEGSTITSKFAEKVVAEDKRYDISNEDIEAQIKAKGEKISAKHILFNTIDETTYQPLADEEIEKVKKKAEDTLNKIKAGEDFDTLMNELSQDPGLASYPDGYTFGKGEMVEEFEKAAFALKENEVSELINTDFGIHIIKRVPLTLSETDIETEKVMMQNTMFENDILRRAKRVKIMYNDKVINSLSVSNN